MTENNQATHRKRVIRFKRIQPADIVEQIRKDLMDIDSVEHVSFADKQLLIQYRFPGATIGSILKIIDHILNKSSYQPLNHFINSILTFMEINESGYISYSCGWHRYIEDIHMKYFDPDLNKRTDIHKQTWRKYKE